MKVFTFPQIIKLCYSLGSSFWEIIDSLNVGINVFFFLILLIYSIQKLNNVLQNSTVSWILKMYFVTWSHDEVSSSHNACVALHVINYLGLLRTEGFLGHETILSENGKVSSKLGWTTRTSQPTGGPNLDTETQLFHGLHSAGLLTICDQLFSSISSFPILPFIKNKYNSLFAQRRIAPTFLKP